VLARLVGTRGGRLPSIEQMIHDPARRVQGIRPGRLRRQSLSARFLHQS